MGNTELRDRLKKQQGRATSTRTKPPEPPCPFPAPIPAPDLKGIEGDEAMWISPGIFGLDIITLVSALWKAGKTTWLAHLLRALDKGEWFCGLKCTPATVLVVTEEGEALWAARRDTIGIGAHVEFMIRPFRAKPRLPDWLEFLEYMRSCMKKRHADLIIFDTLVNLWPVRDENDASQVQEALMPLRDLASNRGLALFHHLGKAGGSEATAARGSGALPAFCDVLLELRRTNPTDIEDRRRTINGYARYDATPREMVVELAEDGSGFTALVDRRTCERTRIQTALAERLPSIAPGLSCDELRETWVDSQPQKNDLLAALRGGVADGSYGRTGGGRKGNPFRFYLTNNNDLHGFKVRASGTNGDHETAP